MTGGWAGLRCARARECVWVRAEWDMGKRRGRDTFTTDRKRNAINGNNALSAGNQTLALSVRLKIHFWSNIGASSYDEEGREYTLGWLYKRRGYIIGYRGTFNSDIKSFLCYDHSKWAWGCHVASNLYLHLGDYTQVCGNPPLNCENKMQAVRDLEIDLLTYLRYTWATKLLSSFVCFLCRKVLQELGQCCTQAREK